MTKNQSSRPTKPPTFFSEDLWNQYNSSLSNESDRGCVLVTISLLDKVLYDLASIKLSHGTKDIRKRLLDSPLGYISGFMAKLDLLRALNVIPSEMYSDLVSINRLRNECAHTHDKFEFTEEVYNRRLKEIQGAKLHEDLISRGYVYSPKEHLNRITSNYWRNKSQGTLVLTLLAYDLTLAQLKF